MLSRAQSSQLSNAEKGGHSAKSCALQFCHYTFLSLLYFEEVGAKLISRGRRGREGGVCFEHRKLRPSRPLLVKDVNDRSRKQRYRGNPFNTDK